MAKTRSLEELRDQIKTKLVISDQGKKILFRWYDPRVMIYLDEIFKTEYVGGLLNGFKEWHFLHPKGLFSFKSYDESRSILNLTKVNLEQSIELDLIEIAPNAKPPVCKITDFGKYKYELQKKASQAKKKQKVVTLKEIKMRPGTDVHDYNFKMKATEKFLTKGDKVKFTIKFKGREMQHLKLAQDLADRIVNDLKVTGKVEQAPKMEGKQMTFIIQPLK